MGRDVIAMKTLGYDTHFTVTMCNKRVMMYMCCTHIGREEKEEEKCKY